MNLYEIVVRETYEKTIKLHAENEEDAWFQASTLVDNDFVDFDSEDFKQADVINVIKL